MLFAMAEARVKRSLRTGQLGADFYAALSGNCKDQSQQHMHFRYAVFSQAYASEKKIIAAADVKRMLVAQDLQPAILKAQDLMQKMRPLVREAGLQALEALDKFEDTLVLIALQKAKGLDMSAACSKLVDEAQALTGKRICEENGQRRESPSRRALPRPNRVRSTGRLGKTTGKLQQLLRGLKRIWTWHGLREDYARSTGLGTGYGNRKTTGRLRQDTGRRREGPQGSRCKRI